MEQETFTEHFVETYAFFWPSRVESQNGRLILATKYSPILRGIAGLWNNFRYFKDPIILKAFQKVKTEEKIPGNIAGWILRYCRENHKADPTENFFPNDYKGCAFCDGVGSIDFIVNFQTITLACSCKMKKNLEPYFKSLPPVFQFPFDEDIYPSYPYCFLAFYQLAVMAEYFRQIKESDPWLFILSVHADNAEAAERAGAEIYIKSKSLIGKFDETASRIVKEAEAPFKPKKKHEFPF